MKILADENIPQILISSLRKSGYDVLDIKRKGKSFRDSVLIKVARRENRLIITFDNDFLDLINLPEFKVKLIVLRIHPRTRENIVTASKFLLKSNLLTKLKKSAIITLTDEEVKIFLV